MNNVTKTVLRMVTKARNKGKKSVAYVFKWSAHETAEDELEALGFHLDRFDMFITDITWENVDFTNEVFSTINIKTP